MMNAGMKETKRMSASFGQHVWIIYYYNRGR